LQRTWEKDNALANYGYWTEFNEGWYQKRMKQLNFINIISEFGWHRTLIQATDIIFIVRQKSEDFTLQMLVSSDKHF